MIKNLIIWIALWLLSSISAFAQQNNYRFINFSHADGLSDKAIYSFAQDGKAFIWLGTANGLYRYDGHTFKHFISDKETEFSQISNILQHVLYDSVYNRLWLSSTTDFQYFDLNQYDFHRLDTGNEDEHSTFINKEMINSMCKIDENILWVGTANGIKSFDTQLKKWNTLDQLFVGHPNNFNRFTHKIQAISSETVMVATSSHLIIYNTATKISEYIKPLDSHGVLDYLYDPGHQCIWLCTGKHLIKYDITSKKQSIIKQKGLEHLSLTYYKICPFGENKLWISGSIIYDVLSGEMNFIALGESKFDNQLLYVNSLFVDKQNNLWRGSYESACSVLPFQNHSVYTFPMTNIDGGIYNGSNLEIYKSLKVQGQDIILIAANPLQGVLKLNLETGEKSLISKGLHSKSTFGVDIIQGQDGSIYFADNVTTYKVDINQNSLKSIYEKPNNTTNIVRKLLITQQDVLIESNNDVLTYYDIKAGKVTQMDILKVDSSKDNFEDYYFRPGTVTKDGMIYYISYGGLFEQKNINAPILKSNIFTAETGKKLIKPQEIIEDNEGNLWVTSLVNGLFKYVKNEKRLLNFNASNSSINSDYLKSIALESNNIITVGSTSQIYRFDAHTGKFLNNFNKQNGFSRDDQAYGFTIQDGYLIKNNYGSIDLLNLSQYPKNIWSPQPIFTSVMILGREQLITPSHIDTTYYLNHDENQVSISFASLNLTNSSKNRYMYRLLGLDTAWTIASEPVVTYSRLPYGQFNFEVYGINSDGIYSENLSRLHFEIAKPFYLRWWFICATLLGIGMIIWLFYRLKVKKIQDEGKIKRDFDKQVSELEMKALRAQMNPHFIFNSLNSIQKFIFEKDEYAASQYLTKFSRLIRYILDQSNQDLIPIHSELELLKIYVEMESLRFDNQFKFEVDVHPEIQMAWMIPSMVIQPHLENAIWHGLLHKNVPGILTLTLEIQNQQQIKITIEDNGIGRDRANKLKSKQLLKKKSYGSKISESRIHSFNHLHALKSTFETIDLFDENQQSSGTKVIIVLPIIENQNMYL